MDKKQDHLKKDQQKEKEILVKSRESKKKLRDECNYSIALLTVQVKDFEEKIHETTKVKAEVQNTITKEKDFLIENKYENYILELPNDEEIVLLIATISKIFLL